MKLAYSEMHDFARRVLSLGGSVPLRISLLASGGSHRSFYRIRWEKNLSAVFMHYDHTREENNYYAEIATFLRGIGIPSPQIMAHDPVRGFILMEDLGDVTLWSLRHRPWREKSHYYRLTLSIMHRLHTFPLERFPCDEVRLMAGFGDELYRWEHNYFLDNCVREACGMKLDVGTRKKLSAELRNLSHRLGNTAPSLVHRDFQSRNVMIRDHEPVLIDFQGMRFGSMFYDLGSLLYDPYVTFTERERETLLRYYFSLTEGNNLIETEQDLLKRASPRQPGLVRRDAPRKNWMVFLETFREASAQRLMQALGAYGFLGLKLNLPAFLSHIPQGIANLIHATTHANRLPQLRDLAIECQKLLQKRGPEK